MATPDPEKPVFPPVLSRVGCAWYEGCRARISWHDARCPAAGEQRATVHMDTDAPQSTQAAIVSLLVAARRDFGPPRSALSVTVDWSGPAPDFTALLNGVPEGMSAPEFVDGCVQALQRMSDEWRAAEPHS